MASASVGRAAGASAGQLLLAVVAERGSAAHPYVDSAALRRSRDSNRNLADAVHLLCALHGRHPGAVDHASARTAEPAARPWLEQATAAFAAERAFLTRLAVAAGPLPSTPGAADSDPVLLAQRHALEMLGCSERRGCPFGAALALADDWGVVRPVLDEAAQRFGLQAPAYALAERESLQALADAVAATVPIQRAMLFGAEQISVQHYGLWDLLEARAEARAGA